MVCPITQGDHNKLNPGLVAFYDIPLRPCTALVCSYTKQPNNTENDKMYLTRLLSSTVTAGTHSPIDEQDLTP